MKIDPELFKKVRPRMTRARDERILQRLKDHERVAAVDAFFWAVLWVVVILAGFTLVHCSPRSEPPPEGGDVHPYLITDSDSGLTLGPRDGGRDSDVDRECDACIVFLDCDGATPDASPECLAQNE